MTCRELLPTPVLHYSITPISETLALVTVCSRQQVSVLAGRRRVTNPTRPTGSAFPRPLGQGLFSQCSDAANKFGAPDDNYPGAGQIPGRRAREATPIPGPLLAGPGPAARRPNLG